MQSERQALRDGADGEVTNRATGAGIRRMTRGLERLRLSS